MAKAKFRIVAIISAYNEEDVIYQVIGDLVQQNIEVYLIDNRSKDRTVEEASRWLGRGLIGFETFPPEIGSDQESERFVWTDILKRKEQLALELGADWYIHHDADEFRESPFPLVSLYSGIKLADFFGFNAIDFALLNFRPTNNDFTKEDDVRKQLVSFDWGADFDSLQIKSWKNSGNPVDLTTHGGHSVLFPHRRIFPLKFVLRHYPIRSQLHGMEKVLNNRKMRFVEEERCKGWHLQYDSIDEEYDFLYKPENLHKYHPVFTRLQILWFRLVNGVRMLFRYLSESLSGHH
ncbi:MAG: glycosyltransferase [Geobacter sp.]|nr:glycosyltransferase [Geobacter sp.]